MAEAAPLDVVRFVDLEVERKSAWGPGMHASRQLTVNDQLLSVALSERTGRAVEQSTPIVQGRAGAVDPQAYLVSLLGGPKPDPLGAGRIAIGYCDACLDASCGVVLGATLGIDDISVSWSRLGFEQEQPGPAPKLTPFWKKAPPVVEVPPDHVWWVAQPFDPEVSFRFERSQYLQAVQAERRRLGTPS
ncbi:hypothetical protein [Galbitalea soli]|uniref:hypothetical protein n=1 Tax=Galbitalea soli TaxID=1268042 RepID=UPI00185D0CF0|nr:hypothetical protein [Galbitalea soli]NYJ31060.1 hypothetical protein [Galbitalea soli]